MLGSNMKGQTDVSGIAGVIDLVTGGDFTCVITVDINKSINLIFNLLIIINSLIYLINMSNSL